MQDNGNLSKWIETLLIDVVDNDADNSLGKGISEKAWDSPIVGFSNGADPLYTKYKEDIGEFLWTPIEIFQMSFPEITDITANDLTVICWALPQTENTKQDMRNENTVPARRAVLSRINSDGFNKKIAQYLSLALIEKGYHAAAPGQSSFWENKRSLKYGFASSWSERHAAFISGLGTFSLTDALITKLGTAVRLGSVIADIPLSPTNRDYSSHNEYCLFYAHRACQKCIDRCPANALSENGHDKAKCREYKSKVTGAYNLQKYAITSLFCGLCQYGIPCESCIPGAERENASRP